MSHPLELLRCVVTGMSVERTDEDRLSSADGRVAYRILDGVPIMLEPADAESWLSAHAKAETTRISPISRGLRALARGGPSLSMNIAADANLAKLRDRLVGQDTSKRRRALVLVVGGATPGIGIDRLLNPDIELIETDYAIGPRTQIVCDAHVLPFADESFDAVVCQAVLEHVLDPSRVVAEIHRVLRKRGLVYSEIPFMQQVHEGPHDVTRYTLVGHRRLFRDFDVVEIGVCNGPGMALAWAVEYFFLAFATSRTARAAIARTVSICFFWLKYFDRRLARLPGGADAASGTFVLGRRRESPIPDRAIFDSYIGGVRPAGLTDRGGAQ
jgi:SAM-dependent methyltransferase